MTRAFAEVRSILVERAQTRRNPFARTDPETAVAILERLSSTEHGPWVAAFMAEAEACAARRDWRGAYGYSRVARYPSLTSAEKQAAYVRSREWYLRSVADRDPPTLRVEIPFAARGGEGSSVPAYLRVPRADAPRPVVVTWGGIDAFKEERRTDAFVAEGWATLAIDMPGTGEAPIPGASDAERMWDAVFDWIPTRTALDARRVAVVGSSTGGYWAAKLAHVRRERIAAAVDHGGPAHHAFEREWIVRATGGEYPFEYAESLARAFGLRTAEEWIVHAPSLSLLRLGVLERPCAPLLVVGGEGDTVFPVADLRLVASHGGEARIFPGGHMGEGDTRGAIVSWLRERLAA